MGAGAITGVSHPSKRALFQPEPPVGEVAPGAVACHPEHLAWAGDATIGFLLAGLDGLAHGLMLLGPDSALDYASQPALTALAQLGWQAPEGVLRAPTEDEQHRWIDALRETCLGGRGRFFMLAAPDRANGKVLALAPVAFLGGRRAFVTLGRAELCGHLELQLFAAAHKLTHAETQVLKRLSAGLRPVQIAQAHGVAPSTVLTQVAAIRAKTGSTTVKHLMATLARLPPLSGVSGLAAGS